MSIKVPNIVIPGLKRGQGVPAGKIVGRLPNTGRGPAQLLDVGQARAAGILPASDVVRRSSTAVSTAVSSTTSLITSLSSADTSLVNSLSTAIGSGYPSFHGALVYKASDETTADYSTIKAITWDTETNGYDTDGFHSTSSNTSRLTIPAGVSRVHVWGCVAAALVAASAPCFLQIRKNGVNTYVGVGMAFATSRADGSGLQMQVATAPGIAVAQNDYFELFFSTIGDSSITITAANSSFGLHVIA